MPLLAIVESSVFEKIERLYLRLYLRVESLLLVRQWTSIEDLHPPSHLKVAVVAYFEVHGREGVV